MSAPREPELFDAGDGRVFCFSPGGRFHGWVFRRHPDGTLYSVGQLERVRSVPGHSLARLLPPSPPNPASGAAP